MRDFFSSFFGMAVMVAIILPLPVHIFWCIDAADRTGSAIALLVAGLAIFPVGWLHGVSVIFGFGGWV